MSRATHPRRVLGAHVRLHRELAQHLRPELLPTLLAKIAARADFAPGVDPEDALRAACAEVLRDRLGDLLGAPVSRSDVRELAPAPSEASTSATRVADSAALVWGPSIRSPRDTAPCADPELAEAILQCRRFAEEEARLSRSLSPTG